MAEGSRAAWRVAALATAAVAGLFLFVGGIAFGVWFAQNFDVVPKAGMAQAVEETLAEGGTVEDMLAKAGVDGVDRATLDKMLKDAGLGGVDAVNAQLGAGQSKEEAAPAAATVESAETPPAKGPFPFKFEKGEALQYRMKAQVAGEGMEALGSAPVAMNMDTGFTLETKDVAADGTGSLELKFGETSMRGDFMGSQYAMREGPQGSVLEMNGQRMVDSANGVGSTAGLPQMNFFKGKVKMEVGPDGQVKSVIGEEGMEDVIKQLPLFNNVEFPEGQLNPGQQWQSRLAMNIPGIGAPVEAMVTNTFTGYRDIGGKRCAVVEQKVESTDSANVLSSPESVLGAAMGFSMPKFELGGKNVVYFDSSNGQMVHTEMDLDLKLDIGKALGLGDSSNLLGEVGKGLGDILGGLPELEGLLPQGQDDKNLLNLNLDLKASVSMVDPETGKTVEAEVEKLEPPAQQHRQSVEWAEPQAGAPSKEAAPEKKPVEVVG